MNRFLIVGTGRSGTTYCQAVHQVCGIPTTHQRVFNWDNPPLDDRPWDWGDAVGEASFMAVPMLPVIRYQEPETRIVLVKRDPQKVAQSWVTRGAFGEDMADHWPVWHRVIQDMFPNVFETDNPLERAKRYAKSWTTFAGAYADATFDIESMSLPALFAATGQAHNYDAVLAGSISTTINSGPP